MSDILPVLLATAAKAGSKSAALDVLDTWTKDQEVLALSAVGITVKEHPEHLETEPSGCKNFQPSIKDWSSDGRGGACQRK